MSKLSFKPSDQNRASGRRRLGTQLLGQAIPYVALAAAVCAPPANAAPVANSAVQVHEVCDSTALALEEPYESVQVGGRALAADTVLGGPPECVGSVSSDSRNVRATLQKKGDFASVRIWALHEGFANVTVTSTDGVEIGVVRVSVYPREVRVHKGGR